MNERGEREPPREIPVRDARHDDDIPRPLVTSVGKVIAWLITLLVSVMTLEGWLLSNRFETIVESRFDRFELRISQEYAKGKDLGQYMPRTEYELRHREIVDQTAARDAAQNERIIALEQRIGKLEGRR